MGKQRSKKKESAAKLSPQTRIELDKLVEELFKKCSTLSHSSANNNVQELDKFCQLYDLVEKIQEKEENIKLPVYGRQEQINPFMQWTNQSGIKMNGIDIYNYEHQGFGLKAGKNIPVGDAMLKIPKSCIMSEETASKSFLGPLIKNDPILSVMGNVTLALHLLGEISNPNSFWKPYTSILPSIFDTVLYFRPEDVKLLVGSPVFDECVKQFQNIARQYAYFYRVFRSLPVARSWPIKDVFTFDSYRWAVSAVMTRQNKIPSSSNSRGQLALIPAWDLLNHEQGMLSTDFDETDQSIVCYAYRPFKTGEQVTIYYGKRSNSEFFLHSGFVYEDNPNDSLALKLGVSRKDPLCKAKTNLLSLWSLPASGTFSILPGDQPLSKELLCFVRIFCMDQESLDFWTNCGRGELMTLGHVTCDLSSSVEQKAMLFLFNRVSLLIKTYPTSLQEDEKILCSDLGAKEKLIRQLLIEEKKILKNALNYLSKIINN